MRTKFLCRSHSASSAHASPLRERAISSSSLSSSARCAAVLGAEMDENGAALRIYYDEQWRITGAAEAAYVLTLSARPSAGAAASPVRTAAVSVTACGEERPLMEITASGYTGEAAR